MFGRFIDIAPRANRITQADADRLLEELKERPFLSISICPDHFESPEVYQYVAGRLLVYLFNGEETCRIEQLKKSTPSSSSDPRDATYQWDVESSKGQLRFKELSSADDLSLPLAWYLQDIRERLQSITENDFERNYAREQIVGFKCDGDNVKSDVFEKLVRDFTHILTTLSYLKQDAFSESYPQAFLRALDVSSLCSQFVGKLIDFGYFNYALERLGELAEQNGYAIIKQLTDNTLSPNECPIVSACWKYYEGYLLRQGTDQLKAFFEDSNSSTPLTEVLDGIFNTNNHRISHFLNPELFTPKEITGDEQAAPLKLILLKALQEGLTDPRSNFQKLYKIYELINPTGTSDGNSGIRVSATGKIHCRVKGYPSSRPFPYKDEHECFQHTEAAANSLAIAVAKHLKSAALAIVEEGKSQARFECLRDMKAAKNCSDVASALSTYLRTHRFSGSVWRTGKNNRLRDMRDLEACLTKLASTQFEEVTTADNNAAAALSAAPAAAAQKQEAIVEPPLSDEIEAALVKLQREGAALPMLKALEIARTFPRDQRVAAQQKLMEYAERMRKGKEAQAANLDNDADNNDANNNDPDAAADAMKVDGPVVAAAVAAATSRRPDSAAPASTSAGTATASGTSAGMFSDVPVTYPTLSLEGQLERLGVPDDDLPTAMSTVATEQPKQATLA
jgi:hypothetical protein